jgi:hypothetical protein
LDQLALIALARGEVGHARDYATRSVAAARQYSDSADLAWILAHVGSVALADGDRRAAWAAFRESLSKLTSIISPFAVADPLEAAAACLAQTGQPRAAAVIFGHTAALRGRLPQPRAPADQSAVEVALAAARSASSPADFDAEWQVGEASGLDGVIANGRRAFDDLIEHR